ncbi:MAG: DUF1874 domain-containing protein [Aeromicrobium sp.]|uniref:STIV orfB116 family protein n=1 Tax=Aeromicrobium sp. TaxID=1871063 RepID=UPI0039E30175
MLSLGQARRWLAAAITVFLGVVGAGLLADGAALLLFDHNEPQPLWFWVWFVSGCGAVVVAVVLWLTMRTGARFFGSRALVASAWLVGVMPFALSWVQDGFSEKNWWKLTSGAVIALVAVVILWFQMKRRRSRSTSIRNFSGQEIDKSLVGRVDTLVATISPFEYGNDADNFDHWPKALIYTLKLFDNLQLIVMVDNRGKSDEAAEEQAQVTEAVEGYYRALGVDTPTVRHVYLPSDLPPSLDKVGELQQEIRAQIDDFYVQNGDVGPTVVADITGGTKTQSIALYEALNGEDDVEIIYVHANGPKILVEKDPMPVTVLEKIKELSIGELGAKESVGLKFFTIKEGAALAQADGASRVRTGADVLQSSESLPLLVLNSSVMTNFGDYSYTPVGLEDARRLIGRADSVRSAIGHPATAQYLSEILEAEIVFNRVEVNQEVGQEALVYKLKQRPKPGSELTLDQLRELDYEFGLLVRRG